MTRKRVIFHMGAPKTGTSFLQSVFSEQVAELRDLGIDYPYAESSIVVRKGSCIGNVMTLLFQSHLIGQKNINSTKTKGLDALWNDECLEKLVSVANESKSETVLFSSEGFSALHNNKLRRLLNRFNAEFDAEFIFFVRDPYDYIYSAWRQLLKNGQLSLNFESFTKRRITLGEGKPFAMFSTLSVAKDYPNIKIINYDTYKSSLVNAFFDNIGLDFEYKKKTTTQELVHNRSLTPSEAALQLMVNQNFNDSFFPLFVQTRMLEREDFNLQNQDHFSSEADQMIIDYFVRNFLELNSRIIGGPLRTEYKPQQNIHTTIQSNDVAVVLEALRDLSLKREERADLKCTIKHLFKFLIFKRVPYDFDPTAYLELNKDVFLAGMDPYRHYSENGYFEGRPYRYY